MRLRATMTFGCWVTFVVAAFSAPEAVPPVYEHDVRPILKEYCFDCHGGEHALKGGLDLRLRRSIAEGGDSGEAMVLGRPEESLLVQVLRQQEMPPEGKRVSAEKIDVIARWVAAGAPTVREEPESLAPGEVYITEEERAYWAFTPIERPEMGSLARPNSDQERTPVDRVIGATAGAGFRFAAEADRPALIRRASLALTGLPPTEEEVSRFVADDSPNAYGAMLDRRLASPHYGERWGRHWLDVAGYADSEGATNADALRPWAWKYRDYVIRSLNANLPFDEFILQQLAGDELVVSPYQNLNSAEIDHLTATGFLRMAADGTGSGADDEASRNKTLGDTMKIVSSAFLGLTLECAQCHDHRYDPIPQRDYFQFRAIFESALNPKVWKKPAQRLVSLYTQADHEAAARIEAEAQKVLQEKATVQDRFIEEALRKEVENFPEALREEVYAARMTPSGERSERQRSLLEQYPSANITGGNLYQYNQKAADEVKAFDARVAEIRKAKPFHPYVRALTEPETVQTESRLFYRGDYRQPIGEALPPAALTITAAPGRRALFSQAAEAGAPGRRGALAQWLTGGDHPLVARVLVNRFWAHYFGEGLVETLGDFGVLGDRPDNLPLLNLLADEFRSQGWNLKRFHRWVMHSAVYRQGTQGAESDWTRWRLLRLDAETLRDRTLAVSGQLDRQFFGQPVPVSRNETGQFELKSPRRSLYGQVRRSQPVTLLHSFDAPVMETNCARRVPSTSPSQALMIMNGDFHLEQAGHFADRLLREAQWGEVGVEAGASEALPQSAQAWVERAFALALGREVTAEESRDALGFLTTQWAQAREAEADQNSVAAWRTALSRLCHALLSSNEFLYVH